jgi:glyoxylase-like metal-dependent hydrolase (beta-lactamase superfamily II)
MAQYEIYALWLGERMADNARFMYLTHPERQTTIFYYLWLIKSREETIVVDTGFSPEAAQRRGLANYAHPLERLAQIRVNPMSIQTLIVSHLHWDHFATPEYFPQATFYLQEREAHFFTGPFARYSVFNQFVDAESIEKMVTLNYQGRIQFLDGTKEILPGLKVHLTGGHTPGHQIVEVSTIKGQAILGIDACHLYRNLEEMIPGGVIVDLREMVRGLETVKALAAAPDLAFPGHDPALLRKCPQVAEGILRLA